MATAARLNQFDDFTRFFGEQLDQALTAGWEVHDLESLELFRRYAHDDAFRAEVRAVAGLAAYTAVRADPALPADQYRAAAVIPDQRQQVLVKAIEDHAARYAALGNPARYIAEAHVPGGASRTEWDWIAHYLHLHPDATRRPVLTPDELTARDRATAETLLTEADHALTSNDFDRALALIDQAEQHYPAWNFDNARDAVRQSQREHRPPQTEHAPAAIDKDQPPDDTAPTASRRSGAAAAFAHPPRLDTGDVPPPDPATVAHPAIGRPVTR